MNGYPTDRSGGGFHMRPSRVLKMLRAGRIVRCFKVNTNSERIVELAAMAGFDCVWICSEHVPSDWSAIERQVRAGKIHDTDVVVRVSRGSYSDYIKPLEADAAGIMVPHIMSAEDAGKVVWQTRFHPLGRRPIDGGNPDAAYCNVPVRDYIAEANRERFVIVQIEDPEPLPELDAIAATPGIDMLFFGPADFSHAIGEAGNMSHPRVLEARLAVAEAAARHGKFAGTVGSKDNFSDLVKAGFSFINLGSDVSALGAYCRQTLGACPDCLCQ